jgi:hypothetical protein
MAFSRVWARDGPARLPLHGFLWLQGGRGLRAPTTHVSTPCAYAPLSLQPYRIARSHSPERDTYPQRKEPPKRALPVLQAKCVLRGDLSWRHPAFSGWESARCGVLERHVLEREGLRAGSDKEQDALRCVYPGFATMSPVLRLTRQASANSSSLAPGLWDGSFLAWAVGLLDSRRPRGARTPGDALLRCETPTS